MFISPESSLCCKLTMCSLWLLVSWAAWPQADQHHMTTDEDVQYQRELRGKSFMAGVSPWFYTSMLSPSPVSFRSQYSRNVQGCHNGKRTGSPQARSSGMTGGCTCSSFGRNSSRSSLVGAPRRSIERIAVADWSTYTPTGNDYGESSYIYDPVRPGQIVPGAEHYVHDLCPHIAFRTILPHFIAAYKAGSTQIGMPQEDCAIAWYRTTPAACGHDGGETRLSFSLGESSLFRVLTMYFSLLV